MSTPDSLAAQRTILRRVIVPLYATATWAYATAGAWALAVAWWRVQVAVAHLVAVAGVVAVGAVAAAATPHLGGWRRLACVGVAMAATLAGSAHIMAQSGAAEPAPAAMAVSFAVAAAGFRVLRVDVVAALAAGADTLAAVIVDRDQGRG